MKFRMPMWSGISRDMAVPLGVVGRPFQGYHSRRSTLRARKATMHKYAHTLAMVRNLSATADFVHSFLHSGRPGTVSPVLNLRRTRDASPTPHSRSGATPMH
jgi:hypothetical protein